MVRDGGGGKPRPELETKCVQTEPGLPTIGGASSFSNAPAPRGNGGAVTKIHDAAVGLVSSSSSDLKEEPTYEEEEEEEEEDDDGQVEEEKGKLPVILGPVGQLYGQEEEEEEEAAEENSLEGLYDDAMEIDDDELFDNGEPNDSSDRHDRSGEELAAEFLEEKPMVVESGEAKAETTPCWMCPACPMIYRRHSHFKQHMCVAHELQADDTAGLQSVDMTEEEYRKQLERVEAGKGTKRLAKSGQSAKFGEKGTRKLNNKAWAPKSFACIFTCYFCKEQFSKDHKLKVHLVLRHKSEPEGEMKKAKEELLKSKLDGCVHRCALCGNKYNSVANITRHLKDVHNMTRNQYKEEYGTSEVITRMFKCELCQREVKHTRNIIGTHMKMVHLISWKEYQEAVNKIRNGELQVNLPTPELFNCLICGVSVKYKREHLNKRHQIEEDVYEELMEKKSRGEDIAEQLPDRELFTCQVCDKESMDFKRHLQVTHQMTEDQYAEMYPMPSPRPLKQTVWDESEAKEANLSLNASSSQTEGGKSATPVRSPAAKKAKRPKNSARKSEPLSTDLLCYFGCEEGFKKDFQLYLHLKLKHGDEDPAELDKAFEAANEEIALTRRSASLFKCALCPRVYNDTGAFHGHVKSKHGMPYLDYKEKYGRCEAESNPFECQICSKVVKYDRNTVHTHLKHVHGIDWARYLDRLRKLRRGLTPDPLPQLKTVECRVCHQSVKYIKEHLRNAHKITEQEYDELFADDEEEIYKRPSKRKKDAAGDGQEASSDRESVNSDDLFLEEMGYHHQPVEPAAAKQAPLLVEVDLKAKKPPKADLATKKNTLCSVCQVSYNTRREFIEHCQVTHGMRFKTKSGVLLPAPEEAQPADHGSNKAGAADDGPLEAKRSKTFHTVDGYEIEIDSPVNDAGIRQNALSKWNKCTYR